MPFVAGPVQTVTEDAEDDALRTRVALPLSGDSRPSSPCPRPCALALSCADTAAATADAADAAPAPADKDDVDERSGSLSSVRARARAPNAPWECTNTGPTDDWHAKRMTFWITERAFARV